MKTLPFAVNPDTNETYARLWFAGDGIDDAPEVRCRCKPDMYPQLWQIAIAQCQAILEML